MGVFLEETTRQTDPLEQPILKVMESDEDCSKVSKKIHLLNKLPSPKDVLGLLKSR